MDFLEGLTQVQQAIAGIAFVATLGILAALRHNAGRKAGPETPKVQEFYAAGALSDMGPVKELVTAVRELVEILRRLALAYEADRVEARDEREADDLIDQVMKRMEGRQWELQQGAPPPPGSPQPQPQRRPPRKPTPQG